MSEDCSIIIPSWNDEIRLAKTLERLLPVLDASGIDFEVIIVVDGDSRATEQAIRRFRKRVKLLTHPIRRGKGGAVLSGFSHAETDRIGFLDSDGPIPPEQIVAMYKLLDVYDCVVASRWTIGSKIITPQPVSRRIFSRLWNVMVRSILFIPLSDTQCGVKVFKRGPVDEVLTKISITNWAFDVSLLFHLMEAGYTLAEYPVDWSDSQDSRLDILGTIPSMFMALLGMRIMNTPLRKYVPQKWVSWYQKKCSAT